MHRHDLPHISSKITNQLFERVDFPLTIGFLFHLVLRKFGLQCLKFMLRVQILDEESQKFLSKRILRLPYLKGISADQSPELFAHYRQVVDTPGGGIGGRVHNILIPKTSVQDVEHKTVVLFSQVLSLEFHVVGCQNPQSEELVV